MLRQGARQIRYKLGSGDLFVTSGTLQKHWEHCLLKNPTTWKTKNEDPRINVTFRRVSRETAPIRCATGLRYDPAVASNIAEDAGDGLVRVFCCSRAGPAGTRAPRGGARRKREFMT